MDQPVPIQPIPAPVIPQPVGQPSGLNPVGYKWPLIAFFSFLLGITSVFAYQKLQPSRIIPEGQSPTPSAAVAPAVDPTANWKTYTNTSANYSIKYPMDWKTGNVAAGAGSSEAGANARYITISSTQNSTGNFGIEAMQIIPPSEENFLNVEKKINNIILKCNSNFTSDIKIWCWVKVPNQEKYLNIQVSKGQNEGINQTFDLILSTFKFLDTNTGKCQPTFPVETNTQEMTASQNYALECTLKKTAGDCLSVDIYNQSTKDFSQPDGEPDCRWAISP